MKKSEQIVVINQIIANLIDRVTDLSDENEELKEAIERRRKLNTSMEELVNRDQPKSMQDMAKSLREDEREIAEELWILDRRGYKDLSWEELPQDARDGFYDSLLKIIG